MNPAQQVIERFGGQSTLAALLGKRQSTVQYWVKAGAIPRKWHAELKQLASERGLTLTPSDLIGPDTEPVPALKRMAQ